MRQAWVAVAVMAAAMGPVRAMAADRTPAPALTLERVFASPCG